MSDTSDWKGRRLGPYLLGPRYPGIPEDEGRLYEAHHIETGDPSLVMMPGLGDDWRTSTPWTVETTNFHGPDALVVRLKHSPGTKRPTFHELSLGYIRVAGTFAQLDAREDVRAHFDRGPLPPRSRHRAMRWGLAGMGLAFAAGLMLLLWPRTSEHSKAVDTRDDASTFANGQDLSAPIAYPMPETPFKEQRKPPCLPEAEVEIRGGCWSPHRSDAPCPRGTAEYQGRCYVPVKKPDPLPRSAQP